MKKVLVPVVGTLGASVIVISGISNFSHSEPYPLSSIGNQHSAVAQTDRPDQSTSKQNEQAETLGLVNIQYRLYHRPTIASNQIAIWIEDENHQYVKTLYASSFTAEGGYTSRPESLPEWRKSANWSHASKEEIERVSLPMQKPGMHSVYWDCTDQIGKSVKPGTYIFNVEGNIYWSNRVIYSGKIVVGEQEQTGTASPTYLPSESAKQNGTLLEQVSAKFLPGKTLDNVSQEVVTNSRGS